uniref:Transmembrane protein n=1 Tax=Chromera velia CCMP2878 TaxID=1169474 RepID=A0A0G4FEG6_9ALVE|mmetsp:Transcript_33838/g.67036  ORF Transcript_33838/g.67036 Transcript_33838/m.67036 type:complete len:244 (-) Transcript_33838:93-824(-)|eukprot:Cvel_16603.t1-p1 / transcript=Cvel_16603.t1 / gene=Cvel_16603 / organism=Chromera_velia_CCMP2878 / gene_product=hypothetical protein / transcript_product=hypothetical protein / location=Cvel_scaffold1286:16122-16850(+) / protein_length=243 / sequence_SO=supercontig / SO=protein_coding / is_pseudo=false
MGVLGAVSAAFLFVVTVHCRANSHSPGFLCRPFQSHVSRGSLRLKGPQSLRDGSRRHLLTSLPSLSQSSQNSPISAEKEGLRPHVAAVGEFTMQGVDSLLERAQRVWRERGGAFLILAVVLSVSLFRLWCSVGGSVVGIPVGALLPPTAAALPGEELLFDSKFLWSPQTTALSLGERIGMEMTFFAQKYRTLYNVRQFMTLLVSVSLITGLYKFGLSAVKFVEAQNEQVKRDQMDFMEDDDDI